MKKPTYTWGFRPRFRANAFGWKASKLASQRLKEALNEIKAVARVDPLIAADGAIVLMEKIWLALAHVDSSSGALGNAVNKTVHELVDIVVAACGGPATWGIGQPSKTSVPCRATTIVQTSLSTMSRPT
jgi:hypothetical protein